jgi:hypothetical protein
MSKLFDELERIQRVADMIASGHSVLRDRYARYSVLLDLSILSISACVAALAFVDPVIAEKLAIPGLTPTMTIGCFGLLAFVLSLFQLRVDWKQRSEQHDQAVRSYATAKLEVSALLKSSSLPQADADRALLAYRALGDRLVPIPEREFSRLRHKHLRKIAISKLVERHPGTSLWIVKAKLWVADSLEALKKDTHRGNDPLSGDRSHLAPDDGVQNGSSHPDGSRKG